MKKALFIDRDGTLVLEPDDYQLDSLSKLKFYPGAIRSLAKIAAKTDYELVMVSNQDGLGTTSFPLEDFQPVQDLVLETFAGEGVRFDEVLIDPSLPEENSPNRKPATGMMTAYMDGSYDLQNSFVIGDRITDMALAANMGCKGIWLNNDPDLGSGELNGNTARVTEAIQLQSVDWGEIENYLLRPKRLAIVDRATKETTINIELNLDGTGKANIDTGLHFFDHMLEQIAVHGQLDLKVEVKGDLEVDEHHTMEDTALALGEAFRKAIGSKVGLMRYGFLLPMDDCLAQVAIDFGGRPWTVWEAEFKREKIGDAPTEMFFHFFKSFSDEARCNLNIKAEGTNEHHKIESIFKAFARAIRMAKVRDAADISLPSSKGVL